MSGDREAPISPAGAGGKTRGRALLGAYVLGYTISWNLTNVGAAADQVADHFDVPLASVGLFTTFLFLSQLFVQIPGGRLVDRYGARSVSLGCLGLIIAANLLSLLPIGFWAALGLRLVSGAGLGVAFVAGSVYVRAAGGRSLAQGLYGGITLAGGGVAVAAVAAMADATGWRTPFILATAMAVLGAGFVSVSPAVAPASRLAPPSIRHVLTDRRVLWFGIPHAATFGSSILLGNWIVPLLTRHGGYNPGTAGLVGGLVLVGGIIGRPLGGILADRQRGRIRAITATSMIFGALGTGAVVVAQPLGLATAGALLIGISAGVPFGPIFNAVAHLRSDAPAASLAVMNAPALILLILGTPLLGLTFDLPSAGTIG
ncbi:MAG: MFS transporter, partial [Actinomycetota bacterium]